jgi:nicotinamidase-related amidase
MPTRSALVVLDAQANMFDPPDPVSEAGPLLGRLTDLVARARAAGAPVVFVRHSGRRGSPSEPGTPGWALHSSFEPRETEPVLDKTTSDAFASTSLDNRLRALGVAEIVLVGCLSEHCIRDTALGALARSYAVTLVADGHGTCDTERRSARELSAAVNEEFRGRVSLVRAVEVSFP